MSKDRINYEKMCDDILFKLDIDKTKNKNIESTLEDIRESLISSFLVNDKNYGKLINTKLVNNIDRFRHNDVTPNSTELFIREALKYDSDTSYKKQLLNVFTMLEYLHDKEKVISYSISIRQIMEQEKKY